MAGFSAKTTEIPLHPIAVPRLVAHIDSIRVHPLWLQHGKPVSDVFSSISV